MRGVVAILQVLDKVTAETLQFEAPVGKRIRYKTLVFAVKVCETRGLDDPQPRPSAYVLIDSQAGAIAGRAPPPAKQVFKGWMFANGPGLHPLEHPVYDAWLVSLQRRRPGGLGRQRPEVAAGVDRAGQAAPVVRPRDLDRAEGCQMIGDELRVEQAKAAGDAGAPPGA